MVDFMTAHLANIHISDSNDEKQTKRQACLPLKIKHYVKISLNNYLTPKTEFQKEFGRSIDKKKTPNPMSLEELRNVYNNVDSISKLTRFLWKRVEKHERINGSFKDTAGLLIDCTVGLLHNFCCRGPILIPRPDSETSAQTTRVNVLDFFCKT